MGKKQYELTEGDSSLERGKMGLLMESIYWIDEFWKAVIILEISPRENYFAFG